MTNVLEVSGLLMSIFTATNAAQPSSNTQMIVLHHLRKSCLNSFLCKAAFKCSGMMLDPGQIPAGNLIASKEIVLRFLSLVACNMPPWCNRRRCTTDELHLDSTFTSSIMLEILHLRLLQSINILYKLSPQDSKNVCCLAGRVQAFQACWAASGEGRS